MNRSHNARRLRRDGKAFTVLVERQILRDAMSFDRGGFFSLARVIARHRSAGTGR